MNVQILISVLLFAVARVDVMGAHFRGDNANVTDVSTLTQTTELSCFMLNDPARGVLATYMFQRCYVAKQYNKKSLNRDEAYASCTDFAQGGLAMWLAAPVFDWLKLYKDFDETLYWVGLRKVKNAEYNKFDDVVWTQQPFIEGNPLKWRTTKYRNTIPQASSDDYHDGQVDYTILVSSTRNSGWADTWNSPNSPGNTLCQYEGHTDEASFDKTKGQIARAWQVAIHTAELSDVKQCMSVCASIAACNSFAFKTPEKSEPKTHNCNIYAISKNDIGKTFGYWHRKTKDWTLFTRRQTVHMKKQTLN